MPLGLILPPPPEPPLLPDGTRMLEEKLVATEESRTPLLNSCETNISGEKWCRASCDIKISRTYERTFRIVKRDQFILHHVSAASRSNQTRESLLGIFTFGLGNIAKLFEDPDPVGQTRKICEALPEVFTIRVVEKTQNSKRYSGVVNPTYFQDAASGICRKEFDPTAPIPQS